MRDFKSRMIVLLLLGAGLLVLFLWIPRQPASAREAAARPTDADSLMLMQAIEMVNGEQPMQGIKMLQELVQKDSTNIEAQYWLGVFAVKSGQLDKAINRFETVLRIDPLYLAACIDLGGVYMEMDSAQKALAWFERGISIDSTNNFALLFAAQTQEKLGMLEEARGNYRQLLRHNTDTIVAQRVNEFIDTINKKLNP